MNIFYSSLGLTGIFSSCDGAVRKKNGGSINCSFCYVGTSRSASGFEKDVYDVITVNGECAVQKHRYIGSSIVIPHP